MHLSNGGHAINASLIYGFDFDFRTFYVVLTGVDNVSVFTDAFVRVSNGHITQ